MNSPKDKAATTARADDGELMPVVATIFIAVLFVVVAVACFYLGKHRASNVKHSRVA